jgi:hypothetical protein
LLENGFAGHSFSILALIQSVPAGWLVSLNVLDASFSTAKFGLYSAILKEVSD